MEDNNTLFETLIERAEDYTKTNIELLKLKAVDKISDGASSAASKVVAMFFFVLFFLLGSVALALGLGEILEKIWLGFLIVAVFYGILWALLFFIKHNWLKKIVGNSIIKSMLN